MLNENKNNNFHFSNLGYYANVVCALTWNVRVQNKLVYDVYDFWHWRIPYYEFKAAVSAPLITPCLKVKENGWKMFLFSAHADTLF